MYSRRFAVAGIWKMDQALNDTETKAIAAARAFAADVVAPNAGVWERQRTMPRDVIKQAGAVGLCRLLVPVEQGGLGLRFAALVRVMEELAYADLAAAFALIVHNNFARSLAAFGTEDQITAYLAPTLAGDRVGSFLLTEPQSGSDAANLKTIGRIGGDEITISGEKAWVSNGDKADILAVYLQTDAAAGWRGIACVLIDRETPGVEPIGPYETLGAHAIGAGGFRFDNVKVPTDRIMIPVGQGFKAAMGGIDIARVVVAAMCAGMLRAGLDCAIPYAIGRRAFGQPIADFQGLQWQLADVATDLHAISLMVADAAQAIDAGTEVPVAAAHAKKFATRAALKGLADCMQAMGADGYKQDFPLARHLACAKAAQYLDGTTEIQNVVISRALLKRYKSDTS